MFCPSCGNELIAQATFCQSCGARQPEAGVIAEAAAVAAAAGALLPPLPAPTDAGSTQHSESLGLDTSGLGSAISPAGASSRGSVPSSRRRLAVYGGVAAALLLVSGALIGGVLYAKGLVDQRDAALVTAQSQIDMLANANVAFQSQVNDLTAARDQVTADLAMRTTERDSARSERDAAQTDAASVRQDLDAAKKQAADLQVSLNDAKAQLDQARVDSSNQQQRASNSDARSAAIGAVLQLDDQIYSDFYNFLNEVDAMEQALNRSNYSGAVAAYGRSQVVAGRLNNLFDQRKAALAKI